MALDKNDPKFQETRSFLREMYDEFQEEDRTKAAEAAAAVKKDEPSILDILFNR